MEWGKGMRAVAHGGSVCVFGLADSPPLVLANGAWTTLPPLPDTPCYDGPIYNPSGDREPMVASVPLEFFADEAPAADDASESSYDGPCQPTGETSSDDSEEGDSTDSDGDDEDDEDGTAL